MRKTIVTINNSAVDTQMTILNNGNEVDGKDENGQKRFRKKSLGLKDKVFYANIRTAVMLFIVTIVFLIAFFICVSTAE
jgi:cell division protein FtsL